MFIEVTPAVLVQDEDKVYRRKAGKDKIILNTNHIVSFGLNKDQYGSWCWLENVASAHPDAGPLCLATDTYDQLKKELIKT